MTFKLAAVSEKQSLCFGLLGFAIFIIGINMGMYALQVDDYTGVLIGYALLVASFSYLAARGSSPVSSWTSSNNRRPEL